MLLSRIVLVLGLHVPATKRVPRQQSTCYNPFDRLHIRYDWPIPN